MSKCLVLGRDQAAIAQVEPSQLREATCDVRQRSVRDLLAC